MRRLSTTVAAGGLATLLSGCPDLGGPPLFSDDAAAPPSDDGPAAATEAAPQEHIVYLRSIAFCDQADCTKISHIHVGDKITWVNQDTDFHEIVYGDPNTPGTELFHSPAIQIGQRWSFTFTAAGDYEYYCNNHKRLMNMAHIEVTP